MYLARCECGRPWISFSAGRSAHCGDSGHKSPRSVRLTRYADSRSCIVTFNRKIIRQNKPRLVSHVLCCQFGVWGMCANSLEWSDLLMMSSLNATGSLCEREQFNGVQQLFSFSPVLQILELVKGMHYQLACQKYFELTHNVSVRV